MKTDVKGTIFREYDIRGVADSELLSPDIEQLGSGLGHLLRRHSGTEGQRRARLPPEFDAPARCAWSRVCSPSGCDVTDIGVVPTPVLYYSGSASESRRRHHDHRQPQSAGVQRIQDRMRHGHAAWRSHPGSRRLIEQQDFESGAGTRSTADVVTPYVDEVASQFQFDRRVKVVADAGNGTAGPRDPSHLREAECRVTELFFEMDGTFPESSSRPDRSRQFEGPDRQSEARTAPSWASLSTATPTASAQWTRTATSFTATC